MRPARLLFLFLIVSLAARAADLKVKVVDPRSAVVAGAQVALYPVAGSQALALQNSSPEGIAGFTALKPGNYRLEVLAPGFAPAKLEVHVPAETSVEVQLTVAGPEQTVVVTATRTPITEQDAGVPVALLDQQELINLQPTSEADALRLLPGAIISTTGRRGGQSTLFVQGGDSDYNKVLIDGVPVNDPGGFFDFGVVPLQEADRLEFLRGSESTLYGSDAMTSVTQLWTAIGTTHVPELRFGADGGNFSTANGFVSFSGARGRLDYNLFGDQFNTLGQGINDAYSNSSQGENVGIRLTSKSVLRLHARHSNSWSGVQANWNFNGQPLLPPDSDQSARQNNFLASADLTFTSGTHWQHRVSGFEYHHRRANSDNFVDPLRGCEAPGFLDCPFDELDKINRAGFEYQGNYSPRSWATTTFGSYFEDENGHSTEAISGLDNNGIRRNAAVYAQQVLIFSRLSFIPGIRFEHNESFGNKPVPRLAASFLLLRGGQKLSGTRLRFVYGEGIKEPSFEESFGIRAFLILPNPLLKPEQTRSFETGVQQNLLTNKVTFSASYFNNLFTNQIECCEPVPSNPGATQYFNLNRSFAQGLELEIQSRLTPRLRLDGAYAYTSTQILGAPLGAGPLFSPGSPLLRRPKHSGTLLVSYFGGRWGASLAGTAVGPRPDSDFTFGTIPAVNHAAGYARFDPGAWYAITSRMTAYVNVQNALNQRYQEVVGYPALGVNFRAGMRLRVGGE
jgi:vitamin B12 transporter